MTNLPLTSSLMSKKGGKGKPAPKPLPQPAPLPQPKPKPPAVPLPGYPVREGLGRPTQWGGKGKPSLNIALILGRR